MTPDWFPTADTWAAWAQWATAIIAIGAAVFAYQQVKLARETRERVAQPDVVVYIDHNEVRHYLDLVIKNFGQTTAYNIRLKLPPLRVAPFTNQITGEEVTHLWLPKTIAVLAPNQEWRTVWDSAVRREDYRKKHKESLASSFVGSVEFDDKMIADKPSYSNPISLDANMFYNTTWIRRNESKTAKDALYAIADTLRSYQREHHGVWVYTVPGDEERRRREAEFIEDEREREEFLRDIRVIRDHTDGDDTRPDNPREG
ncbi:hypothetical protein [Mycobacterium adipatum]|uniref:hypothetical protein n=1 Tax=Mycobacterium adipatum TaxID=1682113 RepID=UPI000AA1262E|nr:hypothetical protein [Mycobacterium adipatum]